MVSTTDSNDFFIVMSYGNEALITLLSLFFEMIDDLMLRGGPLSSMAA